MPIEKETKAIVIDSLYKPIRDYAIIGNLRSAALVSKDGSIDWAPAPFLDSPSAFAGILDATRGGFWSIRPVAPFEVVQEYIQDTNVLVTKFTTKEGIVELVDCMPMRNGYRMSEANGENFFSNGVVIPSEKDEIFEIYRKATCVAGQCDLEVIFFPRFDYARGETHLQLVQGGVTAIKGEKKGILISKAIYTVEGDRAVTRVSLNAGEQHYFTFRYNATDIPSPDDFYYENEIQRTKAYWGKWAYYCDLEVCPERYPYHENVVRSSLILKILFFEPPGSIAASATTSLPEEIGSGRNWDYRFSWLRDSAFTLQALLWLGHVQEATEYVRWLIRECRNVEEDGPEKLQAFYGLRGQRKLTEEILPHLEGYKGSRPVRIGNAAYNQDQWDIYGGILNMVWRLHQMRKQYVLPVDVWEALRAFANYVVKIWRLPDEGLWEVRGGKRHFVHSKVMCWVALDRALKLADVYGYEGEKELWERERNFIKEEILRNGWNERKQSFVQSFGSESLDTSVLLMPVVGFIDGKNPRMLSTIQQIEKELSCEEGLLLRYTNAPDDGQIGKREGAFLLTSFWLVDALIFAGQRERARKIFEKLIGLANHVGLFSEEIDPVTKEFLGNFPQAYTHIGLINSAFYLSFSDTMLRKIASLEPSL